MTACPYWRSSGCCPDGDAVFCFSALIFKGSQMAYLAPAEFVTKMVDAGESKLLMSTRDPLIRAFMAGAILSLAAAFAVSVSVNTGNPLLGALLFPVGFCMLYLMGFDLLTGVFTLAPLAPAPQPPGGPMGGGVRARRPAAP